MLTLSHVPQLFSVETCHTSIHVLRWEDCPRNVPGAKATTLTRGA